MDQSALSAINVPAHLLASCEPLAEWDPEAAHLRVTTGPVVRAHSLDGHGEPEEAAGGRRHHCHNVEQDNEPTRPRRSQAGPGIRRSQTTSSVKRGDGIRQSHAVGRRSSLPILRESTSGETLCAWHPVNTKGDQSCLDVEERLDEAPTSDRTLFKQLSTFNFHGHRDLDSSSGLAPQISSSAERARLSFVDNLDVERTRTQSTVIPRSASIFQSAGQELTSAFSHTKANVAEKIRKSSVAVLYEKAQSQREKLQRKPWVQKTFEYGCYLLIVLFIYFVLIGLPLWEGTVYWIYWVVDHKFTVAGTWSVTIGLAVIYAYLPLAMFFEKEPPLPDEESQARGDVSSGVYNTALVIPCYKAASIIGPTLVAAKRIFPASHIFVLANGNSPTPVDNTEEVCKEHGVNHVWSPIGSKIVAQFVGCHVVAKAFENVLLIDDDCALPPNFPIVSDRMTGRVKCIGYTIKSVGPRSTPGTWCQQAQDLEYKLSGMQRAVAGVIGSATFPHGAISLWNTRFLIETLNTHPGFNVSEDWFFGHQARELGCRIQMCTAVFVETETPSAIFFPEKGGARGGFGEMTVFKQRFYRWNFFFVNGLWYNLRYVLMSWKLGVWEIGAKLFVLQEVYETLLYLLAPFVLPISLIVQPAFCGYLLAGTFGLYWLNALIFNEIHLRLRNERVASVVTYGYYHLYKIALTAVNVVSCYYALYKYARYFAVRHPKVVENERALELVLKLEEDNDNQKGRGRRFTVTAVDVVLENVSSS